MQTKLDFAGIVTLVSSVGWTRLKRARLCKRSRCPLTEQAYHMTDNLLQRPAVKRVADALRKEGSTSEVLVLAETARTAGDAAASLGCPMGAIVKSLVFSIAGQPVMALIAGDKRCNTKALAQALGLTGKVERADADLVKSAPGFSIGGVAPLAHLTDIPVVIDESLFRFKTIFAAAGHPHCVFATNVDELVSMTGAELSDELIQ